METVNNSTKLNEYVQRNQYQLEVEEDGPTNDELFAQRVALHGAEHPQGVGRTKKEVKQDAAKNALKCLEDQQDTGSLAENFNPASDQLDDETDLNVSDVSNQTRSLSVKSLHEASDSDSAVSFRSTSFEDIAPTTATFTAEFDSIEHLGKGGYGAVYKAREKLLEKYYAVKIVSYHKKALDEAKILSDLQNKHIVRYYHCWIEDSKYEQETVDRSTDSVTSEAASSSYMSSSQYLYIQMELCDTQTLRDWIYKRNKSTEQVSKRREDSLQIAQQVVTGVEYIHSEKLIHRDLKPANIMFGGDGAVKIGDFGLVTAEDLGTLLERTKSRGTTDYMAPEQKNNLKYDRKVDIFALGLIFFELFWKISTGHERLAIWEDVRHRRFPDGFTDYFSQEAQIIKLMLSEKPDDRPGASSLKAEAEKWTQHHLGDVTD